MFKYHSISPNFVRITSKIAKQILYIAERELQSKLNLFILQNGFLTIVADTSLLRTFIVTFVPIFDNSFLM